MVTDFSGSQFGEIGPDPELLKPAEVAAFLRVSRSWVYAAAEDGRLPSVRLGGLGGPLRFVRADIQAWLDATRKAWLPGTRTG